VSGAISPDEVKRILSNLGFVEIQIVRKEKSDQIIQAWNVADGAENVVFSAYIHARKPQTGL
jgi:hypothetical protein